MSKPFVCGTLFVSSFIYVWFGVHEHLSKFEATFELFEVFHPLPKLQTRM
jgi:hypothetical protein